LSSPKSRYKLCVSTFGRTIKSLEARVQQARRLDPDLIELRLDFVKNLDIDKLEAIGKFLKGNELLTIRSRREGGKGSTLSEYERIQLILHVIAQLEPSYVDIEILTLRKYPALIQEINRSRTKLIASFHDLNGRKDSTYLRKIIRLAPHKSNSLFAVKIVTHANSLQDNLKVLGLYSPFKQDSTRLVAFCSGRMGIPSRILCLFLGSPYGYASLPREPVAAGQLDIKTMRKIVGMQAQ
jgi:3-dehydroquinate dehydratase I